MSAPQTDVRRNGSALVWQVTCTGQPARLVVWNLRGGTLTTLEERRGGLFGVTGKLTGIRDVPTAMMRVAEAEQAARRVAR